MTFRTAILAALTAALLATATPAQEASGPPSFSEAEAMFRAAQSSAGESALPPGW